MDVSAQYAHSSPSIFSPDSQFVLSSMGDRLVLRIASTLQLHRAWKLEKPSEASSSCSLAFSPCSRRLLACFEAIKTVFAFSVDSNNEVARIQAGIEGCKGAAWISETDIAIWSEHGVRLCSHIACDALHDAQLRLTIWSLATGASSVIKWPSQGPDRGWALRPSDKRFFALAEKHEGRDSIGIYDSQQHWQLVRHFGVATHDLRGFFWSPCSRYLAVWDDPLDVSALIPLHCAALSDSQYAVYIYTLDGRQTASYGGDPSSSLGLRSIAWHPSGAFLALGGFDGRTHILNDLTWTSVADLSPSAKVTKATSLFREPADWIVRTHGRGIIPFDQVTTPQTLQTVAADALSTKVQMGISMMRWSPSGTLLACVSAAIPAAVHIFTFAGASQTLTPRSHPDAVIMLNQPVTALEWQPLVEREMLAIASGAQGICLWNAQGSGVAEGMGTPSTAKFGVRQLSFSKDGSQLLMNDTSAFAVAYPVDA